MAWSGDFGVNAGRWPYQISAGREPLERSPIPRYAVRRCGLLMRSWRFATETHQTVHPVTHHNSAKPLDCSGRLPPAGDGSPIDNRNAGQPHTDVNGGLMPATVNLQPPL